MCVLLVTRHSGNTAMHWVATACLRNSPIPSAAGTQTRAPDRGPSLSRPVTRTFAVPRTSSWGTRRLRTWSGGWCRRQTKALVSRAPKFFVQLSLCCLLYSFTIKAVSVCFRVSFNSLSALVTCYTKASHNIYVFIIEIPTSNIRKHCHMSYNRKKAWA